MENRYELISASISCMYHDIQKIERVEMSKYGMKGSHTQCLIAMRRFPEGITATQLCQVCDKDKAAISRTIADLEQKGLVERIGQNGNLYRARLVLTQQGTDLVMKIGKRAALAAEQAGGELTDDQREVFYQVLATIAKNLHTLCTDGIKETGDTKHD